jgi:flagellin-like protein
MNDEAVSEVIGTILIIALVVILAAIIASYAMGVVSNEKKLVLAPFTFDVGTNGLLQGSTTHNAKYIIMSQPAGDNLSIGHSGTEYIPFSHLSIYITDPNGKQWHVINSWRIQSQSVDIGKSWYIFGTDTIANQYYYLVDQFSRITETDGGIISLIDGTYKITISDIDAKTVLGIYSVTVG